MTKISVPVIMHHSIGIPYIKWVWNHLTCPYTVFESQLKWLKKVGYNSISLQELYYYMKKGAKLPKNPILFTFDDGYLDNWVFAYPLLKKYGFKGTIYINPEFVDPRNIIRNNLDDLWAKKIDKNDFETLGFLSWKELEIMEKEDVFDIQSHTMTHTWYPISNEIIDFRHPRDPYIWMTWNEHPKKKPFLQIDDDNLINYGEPVYVNGRAIGNRRIFLESNKQEIIDHIKENDGVNFFKSKSWKEELLSFVNKLDANFYRETEDEYVDRLYFELQDSKNIIGKKLDKDIHFLCWPGGSLDKTALNIAKEIGYLSSTAGKDMKSQRSILRNKFGENPTRINRIGTALYWNGVESYNSKIKYRNGFFLLMSVFQYNNVFGTQIFRMISNIGYLWGKIR